MLWLLLGAGLKITRSPPALNFIRVRRGCSEAATYILKPRNSLAQHGQAEHRITRAHDQVLCAVEFMSDGSVAHTGTQVCVPQQLTNGCIRGDQRVRLKQKQGCW